MGEIVDKVKGASNKAIGKAKVAVGKNTANPKMVENGQIQQARGKIQNAIGAVKGRLGDRL
jgi:uncharacterized protein YjbJ (UPF0337 family)